MSLYQMIAKYSVPWNRVKSEAINVRSSKIEPMKLFDHFKKTKSNHNKFQELVSRCLKVAPIVLFDEFKKTKMMHNKFQEMVARCTVETRAKRLMQEATASQSLRAKRLMRTVVAVKSLKEKLFLDDRDMRRRLVFETSFERLYDSIIPKIKKAFILSYEIQMLDKYIETIYEYVDELDSIGVNENVSLDDVSFNRKIPKQVLTELESKYFPGKEMFKLYSFDWEQYDELMVNPSYDEMCEKCISYDKEANQKDKELEELIDKIIFVDFLIVRRAIFMVDNYDFKVDLKLFKLFGTYDKLTHEETKRFWEIKGIM